MTTRTVVVLLPVFVLLVVLGHNRCLADSEPGEKPAKSTILENTVRRYFAGTGGYQAGDLITRSQVEELQDYLRKTRKSGSATRPRLLHRILPDDSRLARLFYYKNGGKVLRTAAQELGSYAELEALTRIPAGHAQLVEAVRSESVDAVVKLATELSALRQGSETAKTAGKRRKRISPIYTVDEFLNTALEPPAAELPAVAKQ